MGTRRKQASEINRRLISPEVTKLLVSLFSNEILGQEYVSLTTYLSQHINASIEQLENRSREFVVELFKSNKKIIEDPLRDVTFSNKQSGKRFGKIMHVKYLDREDNKNKKIDYYIKTHQAGSSQSAGSIQPVDPRELFIYKVLEYIGYGPKVFFYHNPLSLAGFYIAAQDAAFTKHPDRKAKFFKTYENLKAEIALKENSGFDAETKKGVIAIDMISRIFVLTDVATNSTNFGRVTVNDKHKWKIIDFDLRTQSYTDANIFNGLRRAMAHIIIQIA